MFSKRKSVGRRGAALFEFALVLPILFMILLGIIEMGRVMMLHQVASNATREGARLAVIAGTTNQEVIDIVNSYLDGAGVSASDRSVAISSNGNAAELATTLSHSPVTVTVTFPYAGNTWGFTAITGQSNLVSRATMRRE